MHKSTKESRLVDSAVLAVNVESKILSINDKDNKCLDVLSVMATHMLKQAELTTMQVPTI